jgi:hypothetical protein
VEEYVNINDIMKSYLSATRRNHHYEDIRREYLSEEGGAAWAAEERAALWRGGIGGSA